MIKRVAIPTLATVLNACATAQYVPSYSDLQNSCAENSADRAYLTEAYAQTAQKPPTAQTNKDLEYLSMQIKLLEDDMKQNARLIRKHHTDKPPQNCRVEDVAIQHP